MARLEDVLGAYRDGKKIRRKAWDELGESFCPKDDPPFEGVDGMDVEADDWEIVPDAPVLVTREWAEGMAQHVVSMNLTDAKRLARSYLLLLDVAEAADSYVADCFRLDCPMGNKSQAMVDALKAAGLLKALP